MEQRLGLLAVAADGPRRLLLVGKSVARRHHTDKRSSQFGHAVRLYSARELVMGSFP